jgi:hypothetical protein
MARCIVSYLDISGIRHTVELDASSLYEAAAMALKAFRSQNCEPGPVGKLEVEIRTSVTHTLTVEKLETWVKSSARSPKEMLMKERLKEML